MIEARNIGLGVDGRRILDSVSLRIVPGRVTALLGPNGAGKSSLLTILSGERLPTSGSVTIDGEPMASMGSRALAQRRGAMLQNSTLDFAFTVEEVIRLGRLPFLATPEAQYDEEAVADAIRMAGIERFGRRIYQTLSGGERQRVQFARAIAQVWRHPSDGTPRYLFLDEPTSALDLRHRRAILGVTRKFAAGRAGILAVLHDLNLAHEFADDAVLMKDGCLLAAGPVAHVLDADNLSACFDTPVEVFSRADGRPVVLA